MKKSKFSDEQIAFTPTRLRVVCRPRARREAHPSWATNRIPYYAFALSRVELHTLFHKVHVVQPEPEKLTSPRRKVQVRQKHPSVLSLGMAANLSEIDLRRHVARLTLLWKRLCREGQVLDSQFQTTTRFLRSLLAA